MRSCRAQPETDGLMELRTTMQEYLENEVQLGWLIDLRNKPVEVHRLEQGVEVLENLMTLSGEQGLHLLKEGNTCL